MVEMFLYFMRNGLDGISAFHIGPETSSTLCASCSRMCNLHDGDVPSTLEHVFHVVCFMLMHL